MLEELVAQPLVFNPVMTQQGFPGHRIPEWLAAVEDHKLAYEGQAVWETVMGELIELQVKLWRHTGSVVQVRLHLAARENLQDLLRKAGKILAALLAQVPAGQL